MLDRRFPVCICVVLALQLLASSASCQSLPILNGGFETGTLGASPPVGWTVSEGAMYATAGVGLSPVDPTTAYEGAQFVTGNRLAPVPDASFPSGQAMGMYQFVDLSPYASFIDEGARAVELSFAYNDADADDHGIASISFFDSAAAALGFDVLFNTSSSPTAAGVWSTASLIGAVPAGARSMRISLTAERTGGSGTARNVNYDAVAGQLLAEVPATPSKDVVAGNLIQFTENGAWSWFQDERAIVDARRGRLLVGSVANRDGIGGQAADGAVRTTVFDFATGSRRTTFHRDIESYGAGDDHNAPAYVQLPDGPYLAMYAPHNNTTNNGPGGADGGGQVERYQSFYRTYDPEANAWSDESAFDWAAAIPADAPGAGGTTYSNLFVLSAENGGQGRVYNIARTQQSPHLMYSDDGGANWSYGGQLMSQADGAPAGSYVNGYFKYSSNGVDRIDFVATEFHPRDFNTSLYHGYIQDGKIYNSAGSVIDADIFSDEASYSAGPAPAPDELTPIFTAGVSENSRAWQSDIQSYPDGSVSVLFKARAGGYGNHTAGADDHRVWYARFDPEAGQWTTAEIAKAGGQLFSGAETDYTGLGALVPNDPDTIYISTEIDPATDQQLAHHEIYRGVTADHGLTWTWTAITKNSSLDNLRPIVPAWDADNTAVLWWKGSMDSSHDYDTAVVGLIDRKHENIASTTYLDADALNTTLADGSPVAFSGPSTADGAPEGQWHQRSGVGAGGQILSADDGGAEDAPTIKTTIADLNAGVYDVFAYFWVNPSQDWGIQAGLAADALILSRSRSAQFAEPSQFVEAPLAAMGDLALYRAYVGRANVGDGEAIEVYVDDWTGGSSQRTWFDGVGYARAESTLPGDFNVDGRVDERDIADAAVGWSARFGANLDGGDFLAWQRSAGVARALVSTAHVVPEPHSWKSGLIVAATLWLVQNVVCGPLHSI